jgi:hypothetical protein
VWRLFYDPLSVKRNTKSKFREAWVTAGENDRSSTQQEAQRPGNAEDQHQSKYQKTDQNRHPLELAEKKSMSGTFYDFMVARAMNMACSAMLPTQCRLHEEQYPDHSEMCDKSCCINTGNNGARSSGSSYPQTTASSNPEAAASSNPEAAASSNPEAAASSNHRATASSNPQATASSDAGQAQQAAHQSTESTDVHVISPFELALSSLYVHFVDKNSVKEFNKFDRSYVEAKQRFVAALEIVEQMITIDDIRHRHKKKSKIKQSESDNLQVERKTNDKQDQDSKATNYKQDQDSKAASSHDNQEENLKIDQSECRTAQFEHYKFSSGGIFFGFLTACLFCGLVIWCAMSMSSSVSSEQARWQSSVSSEFVGDNSQLGPSYPDLSALLSALAAFSVPWESSFTSRFGSTELRVIRFDPLTASHCISLDDVACVPTVTLSQYPASAAPLAFSSIPSSFLVPHYPTPFTYNENKDPVKCGQLYCFDGSGYTLSASNSSHFSAALQSPIFDSNVRAVIVTFSLYSPSLQAAYKGSYMAEVLPTGAVLGTFDYFLFDFVGSIKPESSVLQWQKDIWGMKLTVCDNYCFLVLLILSFIRFCFGRCGTSPLNTLTICSKIMRLRLCCLNR